MNFTAVRFTPVVSLVAFAGLLAALAGCHSPRGGAFPHSGGSSTYFSTDTIQKSVALVDVRSGEVYFEVDVPPGKQLTLDFVPGEGADPVHMPDLMRWQIFDRGTIIGRLRNALSVPNATSRRIEVEVRQGIEYAEAPPERPRRVTHEPAPDWWTPEGGEMPRHHPVQIYD